MKALIIQHSRTEGPGLLGEILKEDAWELGICLMENPAARLPSSLKDFDALIILGGSMGAYEETRYPYLLHVQDIIRHALHLELPTLGICLGAQLIARALGARVAPNPVKEIGWYQIELTEQGTVSPLFKSLPQRLDVFQWHGDTFFQPDQARLLARGRTCINQAFSVNNCAWGLQFHPEVTPPIIAHWIKCWHDELTEFRGPTEARLLMARSRDMRTDAYHNQQILLRNISHLLSQRAFEQGDEAVQGLV